VNRTERRRYLRRLRARAYEMWDGNPFQTKRQISEALKVSYEDVREACETPPLQETAFTAYLAALNNEADDIAALNLTTAEARDYLRSRWEQRPGAILPIYDRDPETARAKFCSNAPTLGTRHRRKQWHRAIDAFLRITPEPRP